MNIGHESIKNYERASSINGDVQVSVRIKVIWQWMDSCKICMKNSDKVRVIKGFLL